MSLSSRLDIRQGQSLVMTPQLQQAIKLLQLNNQELSSYIEQEIEQNPLLEKAEPDSSNLMDSPETPLNDKEKPDEPIVDIISGQVEEPTLDIDYDNNWTNNSLVDDALPSENWHKQNNMNSVIENDYGLEQTLTREMSLREHLLSQINIDLHNPKDRIIAIQLLENIDDTGYFIGNLSEIVQDLGTTLSEGERILFRLQNFDPPGIFARSLNECLALQLREKNRLDPAIQTLLDNLPLLAKRDYHQLMKLCGVDQEDLQDMINDIKALDPKPALAYDYAIAQPVIPDILMRPLSDGGWHIELNNETLPRLLVNTRYYSKIEPTLKNRNDRLYLSERFQTASWLVKALHQRATTILKVASEIVKQQDCFFKQGIQFLRPLILRDIAQEIEMHESTVSRVTSNKYIATPRGIYELKYFFTQSIASSDGGESFSAESIRQRIKSMIDQETPLKILSDDKIVELLRLEGVELARRTVAKYRESMNISSSVQRRREKSPNF